MDLEPVKEMVFIKFIKILDVKIKKIIIFLIIKNIKAGTYENKGAMDLYYSRNSSGVTMISRRNEIEGWKKTPGPGSYDSNLFDKKKAP